MRSKRRQCDDDGGDDWHRQEGILSLALIITSMLWRLCDIQSDCYQLPSMLPTFTGKYETSKRFSIFSLIFPNFRFFASHPFRRCFAVIQAEELWLHLFHASSSSSYAKMFACEKSIWYGHHDVPHTKGERAFVLPMALNCCRRRVFGTMHPNVVALSRPSASELRWFLFIFALFNTSIPRSTHESFEWLESGNRTRRACYLFATNFHPSQANTNAKKRIFRRKSSGYGLSVRYSTDWADQINKADGFVLYFCLCSCIPIAHGRCDLCTCTNTSNSIKMSEY